MENTYRIVRNNGHYEVYDIGNGNFILSGDTYEECYNDLTEILIAQAKYEGRKTVVA